MATTWSAAFLLGVQRLCTQMLGQYARKDLQRYKTEWFIEEPILTYTFIGGDEVSPFFFFVNFVRSTSISDYFVFVSI